MSEKLNEITEGSFLRVNEKGKAYWGQSEGGGAITTLHINVTGINTETRNAIITADKTPAEIKQAALDGPVWCVVSFPAGILTEEALTLGVPPSWNGINIAFGVVQAIVHDSDGDNIIVYVVRPLDDDTWFLDLNAFGG